MRCHALLSTIVLCLLSISSISAVAEVFFSEYIEGSGNNKALEVTNTTGAAVDLSQYEVQFYFNGNTSAGLTIAPTGSLADSDVFVLANSNADAAILAVADQTSGASWFNGDDTIVLLNNGVIIDVIGQLGVDPGSEWGSGDTSTANNTLRRVDPVVIDDNPNDSFDPQLLWEGFAQDTFDNIGVYLSNGGGNNTHISINEIDADNTGTDSAEFIELYDGGVGNTALDGLVLVLFNGSDDASYRAIDLDGSVTSADGYFVIGSAEVTHVDLVAFTTNGLQNGADAVALFVGDASDFGNDTPVTDVNLVDALVYGTSDSDDAELLSGLGLTTQVDEAGAGDKDNHSIQRCEGGTFMQTTPTPGAANDCIVNTVGQCDDPAIVVSAIQGSGDSSPLIDTVVEIEAIVTADYQQASQLGGFYVQEQLADQDNSALTSEGLFIFADESIADVNVGDTVRVAGTVSEAFGLTQLSNVASIRICATATSVAPVAIQFPVSTAEDLEAVEGMLVTLPQTMTVTEHFNVGRFHEVVLASERLYQPTHSVAPGEGALALQAENDLKRIILDDASTQQNPELVTYPLPSLTAFNTLRAGDTVASVTGIMSFGFGAYRIQPTLAPNFVATNVRTTQPELSTLGNLKVASFNVLNYFNGDGQGGGFPTPRGADTFAEFQRQRDKIINALLAIDADIVGLVELENDGYGVDSAIQDLVDGLNDGGENYAVVNPGVEQLGTDDIAVGFIYKLDRVATVNPAAILDSSIDSRFIDTKNRPVLAQTFQLLSNQALLTIAVNHFKSKGSACDDVNDPDLNDGQANCNGTRTLAAEALADWLATDPTSSGDSDMLIIGDLNAYAKEDPITALNTAGYTDLIADAFATPSNNPAYSFVFGGQFGYLDYALANDALKAQVVDITEWHINADEPRVLDYNEEFKSAAQIVDWYSSEPYRSSDHDPVIIQFNLNSAQADIVHGEFNGNGKLDRLDFRALVKAYIKRRSGFDKAFDLNTDGHLNRKDIRLWLTLWRPA